MKTFKTLLAAALVATTLMAAAPADAQDILDTDIEAGYGYTIVYILMTEPLDAHTVLVEVFVDGERWKFQTWYTNNWQVLEVLFDGEPPAGEITINVTPL